MMATRRLLPLGDVVGLLSRRVLLPHALEEKLQVMSIRSAVKERRLCAGLPHLGAHGLQAAKGEGVLVVVYKI